MATCPKLDFRFGDDTDASEIAVFVNHQFRSEELESSPNYFRTESSQKVTVEEIVSDTQSLRSQWVVLELSHPSEDIVAAARLRRDNESCCCVCDIICALDTEASNEILSLLLKKIEAVSANQNIPNTSFILPCWRTDQIDWILFKGYEEYGGTMISMADNASVTKNTMMIEFRKSLVQAPRVNRESATVDDMVIIPSTMEGLMGELFQALHNEYSSESTL